jgi:hypothetical protein
MIMKPVRAVTPLGLHDLSVKIVVLAGTVARRGAVAGVAAG